MEFTSTARITPAACIAEVIRRNGLTPAETKSLDKIRRRIREAGDVADNFTGIETAGRQDRKSPLEVKLHEAIAAFVQDPSHAHAEAVAEAVVILNAAPTIEENLYSAVEQIEVASHEEMNSLLDGIFDRATKVMKDELDTAQAALDASPALTSQARVFREQASLAMQRGAELREEGRKRPLQFIGSDLGL